jgi:hypothetical protein
VRSGLPRAPRSLGKLITKRTRAFPGRHG